MSKDATQLARQFAGILDRREYDALAAVLADDCEYEFSDRPLCGRTQIIAAYRQNTEWAFEAFDRIEFESDVVTESKSSARVNFTDRLYHGQRVHEFSCQQIITVDRDGRINHIRHVDLDGESVALDTFLKECGIERQH